MRTHPWIAGLALLAASALTHAADPEPVRVVADATQQLQSLIRERGAEFRADRGRFLAQVEATLSPAFDFPHIARAVLGRHWRAASEDQRARFEAAFRLRLIGSYADTLLEHGDSARIEWLGSTLAGDDATVKAKLHRAAAAPPVEVLFRLHRTPAGEWKAYDLAVESISLLTNFRSQVATEIKRDGIEALIVRMEGRPELAAR